LFVYFIVFQRVALKALSVLILYAEEKRLVEMEKKKKKKDEMKELDVCLLNLPATSMAHLKAFAAKVQNIEFFENAVSFYIIF
jgi:2,3-bisphosphoglycerate-independent phosphoglycerate mutase